MRMKRKPWTEEDDAVLRNADVSITDKALGLQLERSLRSIGHRRDKLGIKKLDLRRWTPEEDALIRESHEAAKHTKRRDRRLMDLAQKLGRQLSEVCARSRILGLSFRHAKRIDSHRGRPIATEFPGRKYKHIAVMESVLGRIIKDGEVVHHIDCDKTNNDPNNLLLCASLSEHATIHHQLNDLVPELMRSGVITFNRNTRKYEVVRV